MAVSKAAISTPKSSNKASKKINLSSFWFQYVCYSSIAIAIAMIVFIAYHVKKERTTFEQLEEELSSK